MLLFSTLFQCCLKLFVYTEYIVVQAGKYLQISKHDEYPLRLEAHRICNFGRCFGCARKKRDNFPHLLGGFVFYGVATSQLQTKACKARLMA